MPFGLGTSRDKDKDRETTEQQHHKEPQEGETVANNVDPAQNPVNPQRLSRDEFRLNSMLYGMPLPTGCTSTWDRRLTDETRAFHGALLKHDRGHASGTANDGEKRTQESQESVVGEDGKDAMLGKRRYDEDLGQTSVNNYLMGQFAGTGEGMTQNKLGRQRGANVEEPAHHFAFHKPTVHDRLHGGLNLVAGKVRMDQDISTRARAEFHGKTLDGH